MKLSQPKTLPEVRCTQFDNSRIDRLCGQLNAQICHVGHIGVEKRTARVTFAMKPIHHYLGHMKQPRCRKKDTLKHVTCVVVVDEPRWNFK